MDPRFRPSLIDGEQLGARHALAIPPTALAGLGGAQLARVPGSSIDFQDYREYQPGDDLRRIDWSIYARTDRLTVKLFREEVNPHLDLILDGSRSMDLEGTAKITGLLRLAGVFAMAALNARCTHTLWLARDGFRKLPNGSDRPATWDGLTFDGKRSLDEEFAVAPPKLRRQGIRVLLSDLLWPGNPQLTLRRLAEGAAAVYVVQLLARDDAQPPARGNLRLLDSENDSTFDVFIDAGVEQRYRDALGRHQQSWHLACRQAGARLATVIAEDLTAPASLRPLEEAQMLTPA